MAQRIVTTFIDDIDGSEAKNTIRFSYAGTEYEIDLSGKNEKALRKTLAKYIECGRRVKANGKTKKTVISRPVSNTDIREWAKQNGWPNLSNYGRIPSAIVAAYNSR
jgi:hypothetical protein